jgi:hypothetical protein
MSCDVAFLVYRPLKQRRKDNSFDGNDNVGAYVVKDCLERSGLSVGFCSVETAHKYRVVLVSFTSTYDLISYYQNVALRPDWQPGKRPFVVVGGGFGMQNPTVIRNFVDYALFGRGEGVVEPLVKAVLGDRDFEHESVMRLPDLSPVVIAQAPLYQHAVDVPGDTWQEVFQGCPRKCRFCHFTWARKSIQPDTKYSQGGLTGGASPEVTWDQLLNVHKKLGRVRSAIDGFSERLRYAYGKRFSNNLIIDGINKVGSFGPNATTLLAYNISNMPGETEQDRQELYRAIDVADPEYRVIVVLQSTPFRPSLATPMQHCAVTLDNPTSDLRSKVIVDRPNLRAIHSFSNESPWSQLETIIVERATPQTDKLFHAICFAPKLQNGTWRQKLRILQANFDLTDYLRRYDLDEQHPAWFLRSYIAPDKMRKISEWMERQITPRQ